MQVLFEAIRVVWFNGYGAVLAHETRSNDARSNNARFMHTCLLYTEIIHNTTGRKNISAIWKDLVFWIKKTSMKKKVAVFKNCRFLFQYFLMTIIYRKISRWYVRKLADLVRVCNESAMWIWMIMIFKSNRSQMSYKICVLKITLDL